jgi:cytochrome c oxidase subunit 2
MVVDEAPKFQTWLAEQPTYAETVTRGAGDAAVGEPLYAVCTACHGAQGEGMLAMNAPKLAGQSDWYLRRQLKLFKQGLRGTHDADVFGKQMAAMAATLADDKAIENVTAYIGTLPDLPAIATVHGDAARGRAPYSTCSACHGPDGLGVQSTNAPRLAGLSDWYLVTQLKNFKLKIRGAHPDDIYGEQMGMIAASLADDRAIADLVAYINSLSPGPNPIVNASAMSDM